MQMNDELALFPYALVRITGAPFDLTSLAAPATAELLSRVAGLQRELSQERLAIAEALHAYIGTDAAAHARAPLVRLRRDVYNGRPPQSAVVETLPPEIRHGIEKVQEQARLLGELRTRAASEYERELVHTRYELRRLAADEGFRRALGLASPSLLDRVLVLEQREPSRMRASDRDTEQGILKYVSRMHAKTSPFSHFTKLAIGRLTDGDAVMKRRLGDEPLVSKASMKPANLLFRHVIEICRGNDELRQVFAVRLNSSLQRQDGNYVFLTNFHNVEVFQAVEVQPVLEEVVQILRAASRWDQFLRDLAGVLDAEAAEIEAFALQLVESGFIELDIGVSGIDPEWDQRAVERLETFAPGPAARELAETLRMLRARVDELAASRGVDRPRQLEAAHAEFFGNCERIGGIRAATPPQQLEAGASESAIPMTRSRVTGLTHRRPERLVYEDVAVTNDFSLPRAVFEKISRTLHSLYARFTYSDPFDQRRDEMFAFFSERFSGEVPLLRFYEDYTRALVAGWKSQVTMAHAVTRERRKVEIADRIRPLLSPELDTLDLRLEHFGEERPHLRGTGLGGVLQFCAADTDDGWLAVLNHPCTGYGKGFGRFLHLFDPEVVERARELNVVPGVLHAEAVDASFHGANVHPALMPYQVAIPGGHTSVDPEYLLDLTDLVVAPDHGQCVLRLFHRPTGNLVQVFDLGMQVWLGRANLFVLLSHFSPVRVPMLDAANQAIERAFSDAGGDHKEAHIVRRPRVTLEKSIVLSRATWYVARALLPLREKENDFEYFERVAGWRKANGLPRHVFIAIYARSGAKLPDHAPSATRPGRDDYKPQYIDFNSPLFVNLFGKLIAKCERTLSIVEMLPEPSQLMSVGDAPHVTEYMVYWASPPAAPPPPSSALDEQDVGVGRV